MIEPPRDKPYVVIVKRDPFDFEERESDGDLVFTDVPPEKQGASKSEEEPPEEVTT